MSRARKERRPNGSTPNRRLRPTLLAAALLLAGLPGATGVFAGTTGSEAAPTALAENAALPAEWEFTLRPYFFLSGLSGSVTVDPLTFPINSSFSYLLDNVKIGGFVSFTAEKDRWGLNADFQYINLYGESTSHEDTSLDLKNVIGEIDLVFRPAGAPTLRFLAGVRVYTIHENLTVLGRAVPEASTTVVDPVLGAYGSWMLHDRWDFELRGDVGGFGLSSESTYQMMALFRWGLSDTVSIPFGYRVLGYVIQQDDVWMNTRMSGLMLGLDVGF